MDVKTRILSDANWEPWIGEGYQDAYSTMMVPKTSVSAVSTRIIKLNPGGHTETHVHDRVHHVVALEGNPLLETDAETVLLDQLNLMEIGSGVPHRFINKEEIPAVILVINLFK